jgi:enamine deaminase RidA (YjgF/YER057c/UK114 family)
MREVIPTPERGLDLRWEYGHHQSPAIRAGGMVFCSGMVAIDPQSGERQHGTVTSEARRIFENLKLLRKNTAKTPRVSGDVINAQMFPPPADVPTGTPTTDRPRMPRYCA